MYSVRNTKTTSSARKPRRLSIVWWIIIALAILAAGTIALLEVTNRTFFFHKRPIETQANTPQRTAGSETKGESLNNTKAPNNSDAPENADSQDTKHTESESSEVAGELKKPEGNFVSNHMPDGNPVMQSVCVTTAGATCQITFTKGSTVKSLPAQTTDRGGATYWTWNLLDDRIGLSAGSWKIEAKATAGGKVLTAADPINLEIK